MENIIIEPSERTPGIDFDFARGRLSIKGEAYPEDASSFFGPLLTSVHSYLRENPGCRVMLDIHLEYFNSSSAKAMMNLLKILDESAEAGARAVVRWHYKRDDETMREFGEDFSEDLRFLRFEMMGIG